MLDTQLERCLLLRKAVDICAKSPLIDFNTVRDNAGGNEYRCLFGVYQDISEESPHFIFEDMASWFGCNKSDAQLMFGSSASGTLRDRRDMVEACIADLNIRISKRNKRKEAGKAAA